MTQTAHTTVTNRYVSSAARGASIRPAAIPAAR